MLHNSKKETILKEEIQENTLAIYLEDEEINYIPEKDSGYTLDTEKSSCTNGVTIGFDYNTWSVKTSFQNYTNTDNTRVKCSLYFKEKTNYQITTQSVKGGEITVSDNAIEESKVTFDIKPNDTFSYYGASILNMQGEEILKLESKETSFTMPSEDIIIRPSWKKDDLSVLKYQEPPITNWVIGRYEGGTPQVIKYNADTNYIIWGSPQDATNARYDMVTTDTFDITDYQNLVAHGSVYFDDTIESVNMYLFASLIPDHDTWVNGGLGIASTIQSDYGTFTISSDISEITGEYYIGVQFCNGRALGSAEFTSVELVGKIYQ